MKQSFWTVVRILAGVVLLFVVFRIVNVGETWRALLAANAYFLLAAVALLFVQLWVRAAKWRSMLTSLSVNVTGFESLSSVLFGITLGILTPAELGELAGRSLGIRQSRVSPVVGLVLLDRAQTFLVVLLGGAIGLVAMFGQSIPVTLLVAVASLVVCLALFFNLGFVKQLYDRLPFPFLKREWLNDTLQSFCILSQKAQTTALLYTFSFYLILVLQMYALLNAFSPVSVSVSFQGFGAMMAAKSLLPISIADLGTRELSSVYFFSVLGVSKTTALNASLLLFVINMVFPGLAGAFFLPRWKSPSVAGLNKSSAEKRD
ncbi:MAG: lysylphosphatidylglycerol synthase transmembrane domain-containing protein [Bacteroidota bacterium]